jgi:hypothetical protein
MGVADLEVIISKILKEQSENISGQLINNVWLANEFDANIPETYVGFGFDYGNERFNLKVVLEREEID